MELKKYQEEIDYAMNYILFVYLFALAVIIAMSFYVKSKHDRQFIVKVYESQSMLEYDTMTCDSVRLTGERSAVIWRDGSPIYIVASRIEVKQNLNFKSKNN